MIVQNQGVGKLGDNKHFQSWRNKREYNGTQTKNESWVKLPLRSCYFGQEMSQARGALQEGKEGENNLVHSSLSHQHKAKVHCCQTR